MNQSVYSGNVATHRPFRKVLAALPTSGGDRSHIYGVAAPEVAGGRVVGYLEGPTPIPSMGLVDFYARCREIYHTCMTWMV